MNQDWSGKRKKVIKGESALYLRPFSDRHFAMEIYSFNLAIFSFHFVCAFRIRANDSLLQYNRRLNLTIGN